MGDTVKWQINYTSNFSYDTYGKVSLEIDSSWNWNSSTLNPSNKYVYTNDPEGRTLSQENYTWDNTNSVWVGNYKNENAFDVHGNDTLMASYSWNSNINDWVGSYKYVYAYNAANIQILYNYYTWDVTNAVWLGNYGNHYNYNTAGDQILSESLNWDAIAQKWYPASSSAYDYDGSGNRILEQYSYWNADSLRLIPSSKFRYAYDAAKNQTLYESYNWNSYTGTWFGYSKYTKSFDANGNLLSEINYYWDSQANDWANSYRNIYSYDGNNYETMYESDYWDTYSLTWFGESRQTYAKDFFGKDTINIQWNWNSTFQKWDTASIVTPRYHNPDGSISSLYKLYYYGAGSFDTTGRIDLAYDAAGHRLKENEYSYNYETGWEPYNFKTYAYDLNDNNTLVVDSSFNYTYYLFLPNYKQEYAFDAYGNQTLDAYYTWNYDSARWEGSYKSEYAFTSNGDETLNESFSWDPTAGDWYPSEKSVYDFDIYGNQILYAYYSWNSDYHQLVGYTRYDNQYNANGNNTLYASYHWDYGTMDWAGDYKYESTFNSLGQMTIHSYYSWNTDTKEWEGQYSDENTYDMDGIQIQSIQNNWNFYTSTWVPYFKSERLFDYTFDFANIRQPEWVISRYYYHGGPDKKSYTSRLKMYEMPVHHRLIEQRELSLIDTTWFLQNYDKFYYSGFGVATGNVTGYVQTTEGQAVESGYVLMFPTGVTGKASVADSIRINVDGSFSFIGVPTGNYYVVAVPDTAMYPTALTTYYGDVALWSDASILNITDGSKIDSLVIHLVIPPVLNGNTTLSGLVEEVNLKSGTITTAPKGVTGNPVKSASVILIGRNKGGNILARTVTDALGFYKFERVPAGSYDILVDIPGLTLVNYHTVTVASDDAEITGLDYTVGISSISNDLTDKNAARFNLYPNPCHGYVNLLINGADNSTTQVRIFDMNGKVHATESCTSGLNRIDLNLPKGIYIMQISTLEGPVYRKLMAE